MDWAADVWHDGILRSLEWLITNLYSVFDGSLTRWIGPLGLAIIVTTIVVRLVLVPLTVLKMKLSRRAAAARRHYDDARFDLRTVLWRDPRRMARELYAWHRSTQAPLWVRVVGFVPVFVQYGLLVALYYAISGIRTSLAGRDVGFLGITDLTRSARQVCCTTGNISNGIATHRWSLTLVVLAAVLTYVQVWLSTRRSGLTLTREQVHQRRAQRQVMLVYPVLVLTSGFALPMAVTLVWVTQTVFLICQSALLPRLVFGKPADHALTSLVGAAA